MVILKYTCMNQENFPFAQGAQYFYLKINSIIIDYWYNTGFAIPIFGLLSYYNSHRLNIVAQELLFRNLKYSVKRCALYTIVSQQKI